MNEETIKCKKDFALSTSKNSINVSNFSAKDITNVEGKSENESGIQDESQKCEYFIDSLFNIRKHHSNKIIMIHININPLRHRYTNDTKLDGTSHHAFYHLKDFSNLYRLDRNSHGGGILVYVRDDIPSN